MTEGTSIDAKISQLTKRIDDQARFTRAIVVVCTTAVLGVMFYMLTEIFGSLPSVIVTNMLGNMDKIVAFWNATDASQRKAAPPSEEKTETPAAK